MFDELKAATGIPCRGGRFPSPPADAFIVGFDNIETDGPDNEPPQIFKHEVMLELYTAKPAPDKEAALERYLSEKGLHWTKQDKYWIDSEKLYQTVYEFEYIEKRSV